MIPHPLFLHRFFSTVSFATVYGDPMCSLRRIVNTRGMLLAYYSMAALTTKRLDVPRELGRKRRKCGVVRRARRRCFCLSFYNGECTIFANKIYKLAALTRHRQRYRECSIVVYTHMANRANSGHDHNTGRFSSTAGGQDEIEW